MYVGYAGSTVCGRIIELSNKGLLVQVLIQVKCNVIGGIYCWLRADGVKFNILCQK